MTRETAEKALDNICIYDYGSDSGYDVVAVDMLFKKIFDDIDSMNCNNCEYVCIVDNGRNQNIMSCLNKYVKCSFIDKDFCCNKWSPK